MKKLSELSKKSGPITLVIAISVLSSWQWVSTNVFTNGDWTFHFAESLKSFASLSFSWSPTGLGSLNLTSSSWPSMFLFGAFGLFHQNSNVADKFVFMVPVIALSGLPCYLLLKKILDSTPAAIVGSFVFSFNTYFLIIKTAQLTVLVADFLAPLLVLLFIYALEKKKAIYIVLSSVLALIIGSYEFRIFYIVATVLLLYFIFHLSVLEKKQLRSNLKSVIAGSSVLVIICFLNLYWALGLSKSGSVLHNAIFDRGLFGSQYLNLQQALTLFHPFWNGVEPIGFLVNPTPYYFWAIPVLAFLGLVLNRKNPKIVFFGFVTLLGLLLTKQEDAPFQNLYLWLYQHFPGFNAYREASKFYFLIALGYSVLIAALVKWVWENVPKSNDLQSKILNIGKYALVISISGIFLWNIKPFVTGEIGTLFVPRTIPSDYLVVKDFIQSQPDYFRTFWVPTSPRWALYTNQHPKINAVDIYQNDWQDLVSKNNPKIPSNQRIVDILKQPYAKDILDRTSIKYLIVPLRDETNEDDFFVFYGDDRQFFIDTLNGLPFLKRINIGTKDVAVYENIDFKPYISSPSNIYQLPNIDQTSEAFNFVSSVLKQKDFDFTIQDQNKNYPAINVTDVFSDLGINNFAPGLITKNLKTSSPNSLLYYNTNKPDFSYQVVKGTFSVFANNKNSVSVNAQHIPKIGNSKTQILAKKLITNKNYLLGIIGQTPLGIDTSGAIRDLGTVSQNTNLFSQDGPNLIPNPSLELGLWQNSLGDCNRYDNRALLSMKIDNQDSTDGQNSLDLEADQHTACTGPNQIEVRAGNAYLLSFDYKVKNTKIIEYELDFDDPKKTVLKEQVNTPDESWRTFQKIIGIPTGASHLKLLVYGIPDERRQYHSSTHYDNFHLTHLILESPINLNATPSFSTLTISNPDPLFSYPDSTYNYQNIIPNPSFEQGLWQKTVGDCNNLNNSTPILGMRLDSIDATNGQSSLQLEAKSHAACTGPEPIQIKENLDYQLSFDYSSPNSTSASYFLAFDDPAHTSVNEDLPIKDKSWHTATKYFRPPPNATHLSLTVYSYAGDGSQNIITRYDNFSLIQVPDLAARYFLVKNPQTVLQQPSSINFDNISPTTKTVHVKDAKTPFYLAMNDAYHDGWKLELNNAQVNGRLRGWIPWVHPNEVSDSAHMKLNDFENGWYVDPAQLCQDNPQGCTRNADGSYNLEMKIEFVPQRWFYLGTLISAITLFGCLSYLAFYLIHKLIKRKPKNPTISKEKSSNSELTSYWTSLHSTKQ
jgi:hypothetical protein